MTMSPTRCDHCGHMPHPGLRCLNMMSDNDCSCDQRPTGGVSPTAPDEREEREEREELIALRLASYPKRMSDGYNSVVVRSNEDAADVVLAAGFRRSREATTEPQPITDADVEAAGRAIATEQGVRYSGSMRSTWDRLARAALEAVEASRSLSADNPPKPTGQEGARDA